MANVIRGLQSCPAELRGGFVSIGNFDGVHRGHAGILARLRELAGRDRAAAVVFTFDPPPVRLLRPDRAPPVLTWLERKIELIGAFGIDTIVIYPTNRELLGMRPEQFFQTIVVEGLGARGLVEGPTFAFGRDRAGNVETLRALCSKFGLTLEVAEPYSYGSEVVSSTRIRQTLDSGKVETAAEMLGRPHRIRGRVIRGQRRGHALGVPTANLDGVDTALPADGVYAVRVWLAGAEDRRSWGGAMNLGPNPTFGEFARKVEVHLIGFSGELYGDTLEVDFLARLRDTRNFASADELVAQLRSDVRRATEVASHDP